MPISPLILGQLKGVWSPAGHTHDTKMIWAACTLEYFAFLRAGEMTVPNNQTFDPSVHLSVADIAVDDAKNPSVLQINIKQSKTDPFRRGVNLYVGRTGSDLCAVSAMLSYLTARGMGPGPLFRFADAHYPANYSWKQYVMAYRKQESIRANTVDTVFVLELRLLRQPEVLKIH